MTKEEFKEKFKVGDKITCDLWEQNDHLQDPCGEIVYIAEDEFCIKDRDGLTVCGFNDHTWQHYKEPVKKDLEGLKKYYTVTEDSLGIVFKVTTSWLYAKRPIELLHDGCKVKDLTEQEAIERGLRI